MGELSLPARVWLYKTHFKFTCHLRTRKHSLKIGARGAIGYQNEVKKCGLILRLKLDTDGQETKLEGSEFQSGITSTKKKRI